jgi:hypothetical protein
MNPLKKLILLPVALVLTVVCPPIGILFTLFALFT